VSHDPSAEQAAAIIRPRRDADLADAAVALVAVHATDDYPVEGVERPHEWLEPPGLLRAWVADIEGRIVGHVAVSRSQGEEAVSLLLGQEHDAEDKVAVLARLFVLPEARRESIGERLVHAATGYARQNGLHLVLDVIAKDVAAIRLYERLGWQQIGQAVHLFGDDQRISAFCYAAPA
jgi:GNAT superfamily N-acetyltransferase